MKRFLQASFFSIAAFVIGGCPIYNDNERSCRFDSDCPHRSTCNHHYGVCERQQKPYCETPSDCRSGETCASDNRCRVGDCTFNGCVSGFYCAPTNSVWKCLPNGGTGGAPGQGGKSGGAGKAGNSSAGAAGTSTGVAGNAGQAGNAGSAGQSGGAGESAGGNSGTAGSATAGTAGLSDNAGAGG